MSRVRRRVQALGLSLIEVIVALVIVSGFGAALFVWSGQTLQAVSRALVVLQRTELERNLTEIAFSLNPAERPEGELLTATHRYRWKSKLVRPATDQVRHPVGVGPFVVAIYEIQFTVDELDSEAEPLTARREVCGYHQVRSVDSGPLGLGTQTRPFR